MCDKIETELDKLKQRLETMSEEEAKQVNACLNSNSNVKLYSTRELFDMQKRNKDNDAEDKGVKLGIPAVQRGLVWEPSKIVNLWDSIIKGYPIGIFQCYKESDNQLALIDGQQRLNAICLGYANTEEAALWVGIDTKQVEKSLKKPHFMLCTSRHPWGYRSTHESAGIALTPYNTSERREWNRKLLGINNLSDADNNKKQTDEFQLASLYPNGRPLPEENIKYYRMPEVLATTEPSTADANLLALRRTDWAIRARDPKAKIVPLVVIENFNPTPSVLRSLFARINRGGTTLSQLDELYSAACVYGTEFDLKGKNSDLSLNFIPPERLTRLAARMAKSSKSENYEDSVGIETICEWFQPQEKNSNGERKKEKETLINLYNGKTLEHCKQLYLNLLGSSDKEGKMSELPAYVYLRNREDNWLYVVFSLLEKYDDIICRDKKYFTLLCLLPDLLCGTIATKGKRNFCRAFFKATVYTKTRFNNLLQLMATGCIAATADDTFMWPYPKDMNTFLNLAKSEKVISDYSTFWLDIYRSIWGRADNNILYYYQRQYVNKMLYSGIFNPASATTWQGRDNKPWDMDHVIPESWWRNHDAANLENEVGNMQIMYFCHNRSKGDNWAGIPTSSDEACRNDYLNYFRFSCNNDYGSLRKDNFDLQAWRNLVRERQFDIIRTTYEDLYLQDLIDEINIIGASISENPVVQSMQKRYDFLRKIENELNLHDWGICIYEWKQQSKSTRETTFLSLNPMDLDFYHSLGHSLILGKNVDVATTAGVVKAFLSIQVIVACDTGRVCCKVGLSRPIGVSANEWSTTISNLRRTNDKYASSCDDWFLKYKDFPSDDKPLSIDETLRAALDSFRDALEKSEV